MDSTQARPADAAPARPLTIAGIAEAAGVSVPTVSRVLNGEPDVSAATRARVEAIISANGYRRQDRPYHANVLELVFHELMGPFAIPTIRGVERVAAEHDMSVVVSELRGRHVPEPSWTRSVLSRRPAALISVFSQLSRSQRGQFAARNIPSVVVDPIDGPTSGRPTVSAANRLGGVSATEHLIALGHRRIAIINGPADIWCCQERQSGYREALERAGLPVNEELIRHGRLQTQDGCRYGAELLGLPDRPTAVFAANDLQAMGVYQAAREARLRIPEDLSVVGFDDVPVAAWMGPALTTVRQPLVDMGAAAATMALALAAGDRATGGHVELPTTLIVRASTAPPGA